MTEHVDVDDLPRGAPSLYEALATEVGPRAADRDEPLAAPTDVVAEDVQLHRTIVPLEERKERILAHLDRAAIDIGAELIAAKRDHRGRFMEWVETELPFGIDRAERLMAISRAFANTDAAVMNLLPSAWTALYELTKVPPGALQRGTETGEVKPSMTVAESKEYVARQRGERDTEPAPTAPPLAEAHAVALMRHDIEELTEETRCRLMAWVNGG